MNECACTVCAVTIANRSRGNKSNKCRSCAARSRAPGIPRPSTRTCSDCAIRIGEQSKTGRCRSCAIIHFNRLPETRLKRIEGWKKRLARPGERERLAKVATRNSQKAMADPVKRAAAVQRARDVQMHYMLTPEAVAKWRAGRAEAGRRVTEYRIGWCPPKYRDLHRENVNRKHIKAAESREMIERMAADDEALKHIDSALDFLRHYAPVKVLENGYSYGTAILRPSQVIERAKLRGWQPERWAA